MTDKVLKNPLSILIILATLSGCATLENPDPLESFNRHVFTFNEDMDKMVAKPIAETYDAVVPEPVDQGVTNFFSNLNDIVVIANDVLQLKFKQAASDTGRFLVNSTIGILGVFDVATDWGMPKHNEDFGQTLGYWGVDSGAYIVLPFLGPSTLRDATGRGVDLFLDPRTYAGDATGVQLGTEALNLVDQRADLLDAEEVLDAAALDNYTYIRDAYLQRRKYLVHDGQLPEEKDLEGDLFDDLEEESESPEESEQNATDEPSQDDQKIE